MKFLAPLTHKTVRLLAVSLLFALAACERPAPERDATLLVSVRPLALIAREVAGPDTPVRTLINSADPHHYAPSVSERAALERAQLVIWLGPQMEGALAKQLALLPAEQQLSLLAAGGYEYGGASANDPHLWLRPRNAAVMAAHIAERLAQLDPQQADAYRSRARNFSRAMDSLQEAQNQALREYREVPIVVTHDAYGHFFGPAGVVSRPLSDSSHSRRGAKTLLQLQGVAGGCLFGEVPANPRDRQTASGLGLRYAALDPLGSRLPADAGYRELMAQLLEDARSCLAQQPGNPD